MGPNQLPYAPGGGIENVGISRAVNEMLVTAPTGNVIRLFPVWPKDEDASFSNVNIPMNVSFHNTVTVFDNSLV